MKMEMACDDDDEDDGDGKARRRRSEAKWGGVLPACGHKWSLQLVLRFTMYRLKS